MDGYFLFRKLMDMLAEEEQTIVSAKFNGLQIELEADGEDGPVSIHATLWGGLK